MKATIFLIADAWGILRMGKRSANLGRGEVAIRLKITIPDACFQSPIMDATLEVVDSEVQKPSFEIEVQSPEAGEGG